MSRLIIISNRLPFSIDKTNDAPTLRQSSGGLVSALKGYFDQGGENSQFLEKIWVGSGDFSKEDWAEVKENIEGIDFRVEPLFIDAEMYSSYYNGFSNSTIWPLFHYFSSLAHYDGKEFDAYYQVNRLFANHVVSLMRPDDVVWVHDYQLMILPQMLRKEKPEATIGFFLHIPFPTYEMFRLIPREWKRIILQGMLGADLIGFHTYEYGQYFVQSCKMILGLDNQYNLLQFYNRVVRIELFPLGVDFKKFQEAAVDESVTKYKEELCSNFSEQKIVFSVDRLDYTKGLNYRLQGYERFLERFSEWREKVIFILNVVPSRDSISTYNEMKRLIEEQVSTINGKYSTIQWQPIVYRYNHLTFQELCGLYLAANVALITPLRDGMNLVAKEFLATSNNGGVLILSELTGAASELNEACLVNPTDTEEMAESIAAALHMPVDEQKQRISVMQKRLAEYDVIQWVNDFLDQLDKAKKEQTRLKVKLLDATAFAKLSRVYKDALKRCILLDYDGTLTPIVKIPSEAYPSKELLSLLGSVAADEKNEVFIISGRDGETLKKWLGHLNIHFIAEHGAVIKYKDQEWETQSSMPAGWKDEIRPLLQAYVSRCSGSLLEEKPNTLSWHYRNTHPGLGFVRSRELLSNLLQLTANTPLQVVDGNKVLEVRQTGMDKGMTALKVVGKYNPDFILCMGDDTTDEDMFRALADRAFTVKVGSGNTNANYNLPGQSEVLGLLRRLVEGSSD